MHGKRRPRFAAAWSYGSRVRSLASLVLFAVACGSKPPPEPAPPESSPNESADPTAPSPAPSTPAPAPGAEQTPLPGGPECGGFAGIQCPSGLECVDDPSDGCDPAQGGHDCGGICRAASGGDAP